MFGYVQVDKDELKLREYKVYRAYYCGLCRSLQKNYGKRTKLLLNYDCTFAALLLSLISGADKTWIEHGRCLFHPLKAKEPMIKECAELKFAAALNVILAYYNLDDKWQDNRSFIAKLGMLFYRRSFRKAVREFPNMNVAVKNGLESLHSIENASVADIDAAANASAEMLSGAVDSFDFTDDTEKHIMNVLVYNIGRWIYIADAWQDRNKDEKTKNYNAVNLQGLSKENVMNALYTALGCAKEAFDLLNIKSAFVSIAENVLCKGCVAVTETVLSDAYKANKK